MMSVMMCVITLVLVDDVGVEMSPLAAKDAASAQIRQPLIQMIQVTGKGVTV